MSDQQNKPNEGAKETSNVDLSKYVPKEDFDKLSNSTKELEARLDEAKLSLLDPSYIEFLETKKGRGVERKIEAAIGKITDTDVEHMSSRQLLQLAVERAKEAVINDVIPELRGYIKQQGTTLSDVLAVLELQAVEKKYKDFDNYRDDTRKILETSQTPLTIEQAYKQAKLDRLEAEGKLTPSEKKDAEKQIVGSEKPTASVPAATVEKTKFKSKEDAGEDAWNKSVGAGKDYL